jgi:outer membrane receptor protein involved in Fe transport
LKPVVRSLALAFGGVASAALVALPAYGQQPQQMERVEITGSNIKRTDLETVNPVIAIDRAAIERSGATTLTELLVALPVVSGGSFTESVNAGNSFAPGTASVSLRGLGVNTVLVLLNGRRVAGYGFAQNINEAFVDLNSIPVTAIERIDILKDGASAIYGSDAISGVINVILRKDFQGLEVGGMYGFTADGGGTEYRANVTGGWGSLAKDKFNIMGTIDYFSRSELSSQDRSFSKSANQSARGGYDQRSPTGNPGTWTGAAVPGGYQPFAKCPPELVTSEILGVPTCAYDFASSNWLLPKTERLGLFVKGIADFMPSLQGFAELSYTSNTTNQSAAATPGTFATPAANPSNPFGAPVSAIYRTLDIGLRLNEIESDNTRFVAGLRGNAAGWDWETAGTWSKNEATNTGSNYVDIRNIRAAIAGTFAGFVGQYYNLTDNSKNSPEMLAALRYSPVRTGESEIYGFDAKGSRELFQLAGGAAAVAIGGEWYHESISDTRDPTSAAGFIVGSGGVSSAGDRNRTSLYAELSLPFFKGFESQWALRYDDYSDFGSKVSPKIGMSYRPVGDVLIRGGWGQGFRAPSLVELYLGQSISFPNVRDVPRCDAYTAKYGAADPRTKGVCGSPQVRTQGGGNPQLDAEESENIYAGIVWDITKDLSFAFDYYNIKHTNRVTSPTASYVVQNFPNCPGGCANGTDRAPQNPDDLAANAPGGLYGTATTDPNRPGVFNSYFNATQQSTYGYDAEIRYRFSVGGWGNFTTSAFGTYIGSFKQQNAPNGALNQYVGTYEYPRIRASATGLWEIGPWASTLRYNWRDSFKQYYGEFVEQVDSFGTWDLQVAYKGFKNTTITLGAINLFNNEPPFADQQWTGYADTVDSPRGGFYYISASYKFF